MPRGGRITKRKLIPDPVYGHRLVTRFINRVMKQGKKALAQRLVYDAFSQVEKISKNKPLEVFLQAIENLKPNMEVRSRRIGGAAYQVPIPVRGDRKEALAIRWLIGAASKRPNKEHSTFSEKLAAEIIACARGEGIAIQKKKDVQRMAEANKAFAHFRW
ncbi:30S ribosomal protein S7 [Patescibacteria group bacterium]